MTEQVANLTPPEWSMMHLRELCAKITSGGTPSRKVSAYFGGDIPWVKTMELLDCWLDDTDEKLTNFGVANSSAKILPERTVLMAMYGATVGQLGILRRPMTCNQAACALIVNADVADFRYVYYQLLHSRPRLRSLANGAAQQNLSARTIADFEIPLPPLAEQRAIAGVLGALDDKIESNRRISQLLLEVIQLEFQLEVADVDDVPFTSALKVEMGSPFSGDQFAVEGVGRPLIRIRDLKTMQPQVWTTEHRQDEIRVERGDVLVGMDAEFRSTLWTGAEGVLNQRMCRFVPLPHVGTAFTLLSIRPDLEYCERAKSGTTVIHLNKADIDRFRVPNLTIQRHLELKVVTQPMVERLVSLGTESQSLANLRDALLPELLSGRLRVRDAEKVVEEVV
jgi:type I restriction enzyme S subunit